MKNQRDTELFTVSGVTGGDYIRLATLDQYDLHVYNVADSREKDGPSGSFLRTAGGVDLHEATAEQRTSTITIGRSEEHTSELQSRGHLVCRLLLEKKKKEQTQRDVRM